MAYKLVSYDGRPVMKLSEGKIYRPGPKQVFRLLDAGGMFDRDVIGMEHEQPLGSTALLEEVMASGARTGSNPSLEEIRDRFDHGFGCLDQRFKSLTNAPHYTVATSPNLERLTAEVQGTIAVE
jgi:nicotinate phosphoribosyltransferase